MRVLVAVALVLVFLEALLALAGWAGYHWLGGWWGAALLGLAVLLLIVAPWLGEARAELDSQAGRLVVSLGWWFALRATQDPREVRIRILFVPLRLRPRTTTPPPSAPPEKVPAKRRRARPSAASVVRMLPAALQALVDLLGEAREVSVRVQAPVQNPYADAGLAAVVGHQQWGPLRLTMIGSGDRALYFRYRAGLLRTTLSLLYCALQGRPWRLRSRPGK